MSSEDLPLTVDSLLLFSCLEAGTTIGDILIWDGTHWVSTPAGNGNGNIVGPIATASTNTALTRWNGTGGRTIQDSTVTLSNAGVFSSLITSTYVDSATNYRLSGAILLTQTATNLICGLNVMPSLSSGTNNTGTGADVLSSLTTGSGNTVVGSQAVISNLIGDYNTVVGAQALRLGTASNNTAMGYRALYNVSTGGSNTSLGHTAGNDITTGSNNIILGVGTSAGSTSAANRIVLGVGGSGVANNALTVHGSTSITDFYFPALSTTAPIANVLYFDTATGRIQYGTTPAPTVVNNFLDNAFRVQNSVTPTKQLAFNCVNISSSTTRTFTIPNVNGILPTTPNTTSVATGELSYAITVTGTNNTTYGKTAGVLLSDGIGNTAYGSAALSSVTTAASNTAVGYQALTVSTAAELTAMGFRSLSSNTSGIQNTAFGTRALATQSTATSNTAMGFQAGQAITFGSQNTIFGVNAMLLTTTGASNHAAGYQTLAANTTGSYNIAIGDSALSSQQITDANLAIGYQAMQSNTTATQCLAVGYQALKNNLIGTSNTAVGYGALRLSTAGGNTGLGASVLYNNSTGTNNTSVGALSLFTNTSGAGCTAMGQQTLYNNTIGLENSAFGYQAMINNLSGSQNSTLGMNSLGALTTGNYNTAVGHGAGGVVTTGSNNIMLGALSRARAIGDSNSIVFGYNTVGNGSNTFTVSTNCVPVGTTSYVLYYNTSNGSITYGATSGGGGSTFLDGVFRVQNTATPTKQLAFDCVNISSATTRTFVVPDANGILPALANSSSLCTGITSYTFTGIGFNTIYGTNTGAAITTGYSNTLVGSGAGSNMTTGYRNTFIGNAAGSATSDRNNNILIGAGTSSPYNNSIVIGNSGAAIANNSLTIYNVDIPITGFYFPALAAGTASDVLYYNSTTGSITYGAGTGGGSTFLDGAFRIQNTATPTKQLAFSCSNISSSTTRTITAPDSNGILPAVPIASCLATGAATYTIAGVDNTYYGILAGTATTTGFSNTAIGKSALLYLNSGARNTAVGSQTILNVTAGTDNTAVGYNALNFTSGNSNTALGSGAGSAVGIGASNILIGVNAGTTLATGSGNIIIGASSNVDNSARTSVLVLGASTTSIAANNSTTIGTAYVRNTSSGNILYYNSSTGEVSYGAAATGGTTFLDGVFRVQNTATPTKQLAFDCVNISSATTRTFVVPDANGILPALANSSSLCTGITSYTFTGIGFNTIYGTNTGADITTGSSNTLLGHAAGNQITTGYRNTFIGESAGATTSDRNNNILIGAGTSSPYNNSIVIGNSGAAIANNSLTIYNVDIPITGFYFPALAAGTASDVLYYNSTTGSITYGAGTGGGSTFLDGAFRIQNTATPTKQLAFSCSNISSSTTRTITAPDSNGILPAVPISSCLATGAATYTIAGVDNTYYGILSGTATNTGFSNTAIGKSTLLNLVGGSRNTAVGSQALLTSISGTDCTAVGYNALTLATGNSNTALGSGAGSAVADGSSNVLVGVNAASTLTSGAGNIIIGSSANVDTAARTSVLVLGASTTSIAANNSTTIGTAYVRNTSSGNILYYNSSTGEVSYGAAATGGSTFLDNVFRIQNSSNSTKQLAFDCSNISNSTIRTVTVPNANTILATYNPGTSTGSIIAGNATFINTPAGSGQTGFGVGALQSIQSGSFANTAVGYQAMQAATTDTGAVAIGNYALSSATGTNSTVAIGSESMRYVSNSVGNTAVGDNSLRVSGADYNTSIGASSLYNLTSGGYNTAIGYQAGLNYTGSESNNILISNQGTVGDSAVIRIGTSGTHTACFIAGNTTVNGISCTSETISSSTALSATLDSIIDASTSTLACTLAAGNTNQCKLVRLYNRRSNTVTISCVAAGGGTFQLTPAEPSRLLRYNASLLRWQIESGFSATAPDSFYPTTQQGTKLIGTGITGSGQFGFACALSSDGNTMAVGGQFDNSGVGAVWVFTRSGTTWTQQGTKFTGTGITGAARFGQEVAISSDGNTLAVGAYADNTNQGAVWVFTRSAGVWTQQGTKLTASGSTGISVFGYSLSLSANGNTMAIGGYTDNTNIGAVWVFIRSGSTWTQQGSKLVATGITGTGQFGYSVSLSADGNTFASGAYNDNATIGAVWVFTRLPGTTTWFQQNTNKLTGSDITSFARFGSSVSLSSDANTLAIGGFADNTNIGAVWIFTRNNGIWSQQTGNKLTGAGETGTGQFGYSVALTADGNTLVTSAPNDNATIGAVWVFTRSGGVWALQGSKLTGTGETSTGHFGTTLSLAADGTVMAVGGYADNASVGAAWVFI